MTSTELSTWRTARDLSQAELARLLSVSVPTVWRWENKRRAIPPYLSLALSSIGRNLPRALNQRAIKKGSTQLEKHSRKKDKLKDFLKGE